MLAGLMIAHLEGMSMRIAYADAREVIAHSVRSRVGEEQKTGRTERVDDRRDGAESERNEFENQRKRLTIDRAIGPHVRSNGAIG